MRFARNSRNRNEAASAQCRSSTTSNCGCRAASPATSQYRVDRRSRPPYDPAMMVVLLLYAYARGIRFPRLIERRGERRVAFRVLAAQ